LSYGTYLATRGGDFQFSNLDLNDQLIDTDGHIQFVSCSKIPTFTPFVPASLIGHGFPVILVVGGILFGARLVKRSKKRRPLRTAIRLAA
jgi:hypothetical protein